MPSTAAMPEMSAEDPAPSAGAVCRSPIGAGATVREDGEALPRETAGNVPRFQVLTRLHELESLEQVWHDLASAFGSSPFQAFGWNRAWARHFPSLYDQLAVFVLSDRGTGEISAILPCYQKGHRLRLLGDEHCDYQDGIARSDEDLRQLMLFVFEWARRTRHQLDFLRISEKGRLWAALPQSASTSGFIVYQKPFGGCPWFTLAKDLETHLSRAKASVRKRVRRAFRRLENLAPEHQFRLLGHGEITRELIADIADLHGRNQYRKKGASILQETDFIAFLGEAAGSADTGLRIIEVREKGGKLIAFDVGFEYGHRFFVYIGAFDAPYEEASPGICLLGWQMDTLPARGVIHFDFLCGDEPYKFDYATDSYAIMSVRLASDGPLNRLVFAARRFARRCKVALKPALRRLGLLG